MTSLGNLTPAFVEWMKRAQFTCAIDSLTQRVMIFDGGGEIVKYLNPRNDGWIRVTSSYRGEPERWLLDAASLDVVERYFFVSFGNDVRRWAGINGRVRVPFRLDELAPGASLQDLSGSTYAQAEEISLNGQPLAIFAYNERQVRESVKASHYCAASLEELQKSFLSIDGKPLFELA